MKLPPFIKEVIWSFYPPRYRQLAEKPFSKSLGFMSKMMLIAFIISGIFFIPKIALLTDNIEAELDKISLFQITGNITQSESIAIPQHNPWIVIDTNNNLTLTKELFVIDKNSVQYRVLKTNSAKRSELADLSNKTAASRLASTIVLLMLPGVALLLYVRMWLKYLLLIFLSSCLFFIILELTKFKLKFKELLNIGAHAITSVILVEVVSAAFTTAWLLPKLRFLGVSIFAITTIMFFALMAISIAGYHIEDKLRK